MDDAVLISTSIRIAALAHETQRDKAGKPYILHPLRVMAAVQARGGTIAQQCAAVLHDVLEDTAFTADDLRNAGLTEEIVTIVEAVTHPKGESYEDYLGQITETPGAVLVKEADALDNYNRLPALADEETRERLFRKYTRVLDALRRPVVA